MTQPATLLVLFGATGDLATRMLWPSLYGLEKDGLLPAGLRILGQGRGEQSDEDFRRVVAEVLERRVPAEDRDPARVQALLGRIHYHAARIDDAADMSALADRICALRTGEVLYHLSTAPRFYAPIATALSAAGLSGPGTRIMIEKPIGHDLPSSVEINEGVGSAFAEERIYRTDHYLGKEGVQNLLALRFGNALFEPLWNARHIAQVQITVAETVGVEGRGDYYDHSGAMRDMVQNHLLQLLCLFAMEPPAQFEPSSVRNEKTKVLRSLRPITASDAATHSVAGQYTAGATGGVAVPGYREELGRDSQTETFVALRAHIDNWRWSGVPFYLRTGKRLPRRSSEIYVQFHKVPHSIFGAHTRVEPNALVIQLQPEERISLTLMSKMPGLDRQGLKLSEIALDMDFHDTFAHLRKRIAYERLYLDAIEGNGTLFVRRDETELAWQWIDGIFAAWREAGMSPKSYPAGTWGPTASIVLPERHGHSWRE